MCQISVFMGRRQRRRAQTDADILIINKINLRLSAYSASSASGNITLTHPLHGQLGRFRICLGKKKFNKGLAFGVEDWLFFKLSIINCQLSI